MPDFPWPTSHVLILIECPFCPVSSQLPFHASDAVFFQFVGQFVVRLKSGLTRSEISLAQVSFVCGPFRWVAQLTVYPACHSRALASALSAASCCFFDRSSRLSRIAAFSFDSVARRSVFASSIFRCSLVSASCCFFDFLSCFVSRARALSGFQPDLFCVLEVRVPGFQPDLFCVPEVRACL